MSWSEIILLTCFCAGTAGCFVALRLGTDFFHAYRLYFVRRVGPDLKHSFVVADVALLFFSSLAMIAVLTAAGYVVMGPVGLLFGIVAGFLTPSLALRRFKKRRSDQFIYQLPDALHSLSSTLRSGVNLPKGLQQLATWQPAPLSQEFGLVLSEYQIGRDLSEALASMHERMPRPELELMNSAINISRSVGGNLADTLESLALTLQEKLTVEGKINALTAMGKLQGWVVSFVPVFMGVALYMMDPERMQVLFADLHGWITLGIVGLMMVIAVVMIRKIVNIDV